MSISVSGPVFSSFSISALRHFSLFRYFRLRPFDTCTPEGRAKERVRRASLTALTAATARVIAMLTPLVSLPLTLGYLGLERYGMWQTISSVIGMMAFADLGMGSGLQTSIAQASGRNDKQEASRLVASAFFMLAAVAAVLLLGFLSTSPFVAWSRVFNVTSPLAKSESSEAMVVCALCFALNLPLGIVLRIQSGLQEGYQSNLWQCLAYLLALGALFLVVYAHAAMPVLVLVLMGVPVLVLVLNSMVYFGYHRPWLRPSWRHFHAPTAHALLRTGGSFLAVSILMAIGLSADNLVTAQILGAEAVTQLAVPARLAAPLMAVPMMAFLPMWSAYGEAIARGEIAWVQRNVARLVRLAILVTGLAATCYVFLGPWLIHLLVGKRVVAPTALLLGFGLYSVETAAAGPAFMVLNGAKLIRPQIWMYLAFTAVSITAKIVFTKRFGILAVPWATAIPYALLIILPLWLYVRRALAKMARQQES